MGIQIETHRVLQFSETVRMLAQQKGSRLRGLVDEYPLKGKAGSIDLIGKVTPTRREGRHADTRLSNTDTYRRWYFASVWDWAELIENEDKLNMLYDPTSPLTRNAAYGFARTIDQVIIDAAFATVTTGEERGSTVAWSSVTSTQQVAAGGTGLDLAKLLKVRERFDLNDELDNGQIIAVVSPKQMTNLLGTTEVKSNDYNSVKALVNGEVDTFMGMKFVTSNLLGVDGSSARRCIFFNMPSIAFVEQKGLTTKVSERPDKNYNTQLFLSTVVGAVRANETGIMEVLCVES